MPMKLAPQVGFELAWSLKIYKLVDLSRNPGQEDLKG
jgi:hypothetical protein